MSPTLRVYDPALCCSTGVCGPSVDPELARISADLAWLQARGVMVERYNLAQQPGAFVTPAVRTALETLGDAALPLVQLDETTIATGHYPSRAVLAKLAGLGLPVVTPAGTPQDKSTGCCGGGGHGANADPKPEGSRGGSCC